MCKKQQKNTYYPTCPYCGQQQLPDAEYDSQEHANKAAAMVCDCYDAREYQRKEKEKQQRQDNIIRIKQRLDDLQDYCSTRNLELEGDLYDLLHNNAVKVLDDIVACANFKFGRFKVKIAKDSKGVLVISFNYSDAAVVKV